MLQAFGNMIAPQQKPNQDTFQQLLQSVGNGTQTGETPQKGILAKGCFHRVTEFV